ncbi:chaperonin GroES [Atopostipes suicloacalis DSM 15692]|uniref:Co-chaperonin GroES n=1 Tax=Atopostipes suicloacalis DSM 15692 TaxID=1121025 RepID=A0A1M4WTF6_9LACT|nr:co-chaperone GroES [Atopostipes suicloacalis]SHE84571.1 chaperonin GroES [Atopostipes suicloacalis DSM 15692]
MLKPLGNRVLLELVEEETTTPSGIVLPDSAKEKPQFAIVVAVGAGKLLDSGERSTIEVNVGDKVLFEKYSGSEVKYEGTEYLVVKDTDIIAVAE